MHLIQFLFVLLGLAVLAGAVSNSFAGRFPKINLVALGLALVVAGWLLSIVWSGGGATVGG